MKKLFLLILIIPLALCAQKNNKGTLKIRKHPKIHAYASVAGIFEGMITRETLLANPKVELNSSKKGEIISFEVGFAHDGDYSSQSSKGENFQPKTISLIKNNKVKRVCFEKIYAKIDNDTIQLNNITLKFGLKNSTAPNPKLVAITYLNSNIFNSISKANPVHIRNVKGLYNDKTLKIKSFNIQYTMNGTHHKKKIINETELKFLIRLIKNLPVGLRLYITNILFLDGNQIIKGIPIGLKIIK